MATCMQRRSFVLGAAAGGAIVLAAGAMAGFGQPGVGAAGGQGDVRLTWSNDGRTVYIWSLIGRRLDYVDTARVPAPRGGNAGGDNAAPEQGDDQNKNKGNKGRGHGGG